MSDFWCLCTSPTLASTVATGHLSLPEMPSSLCSCKRRFWARHQPYQYSKVYYERGHPRGEVGSSQRNSSSLCELVFIGEGGKRAILCHPDQVTSSNWNLFYRIDGWWALVLITLRSQGLGVPWPSWVLWLCFVYLRPQSGQHCLCRALLKMLFVAVKPSGAIIPLPFVLTPWVYLPPVVRGVVYRAEIRRGPEVAIFSDLVVPQR